MIARRLGRSPSTVSPNVAVAGHRERYRAWRAEETASRRAQRPKIAKLIGVPQLRRAVEQGLRRQWSPANRRTLGPRLSRRSGDACVARDDIFIALCAGVRGAAPGAHTVPADGARPAAPRGRATGSSGLQSWEVVMSLTDRDRSFCSHQTSRRHRLPADKPVTWRGCRCFDRGGFALWDHADTQ